jgi:hypothetical protein
MPSPDSSYCVNEPDVVAESIAGEVLIINLRSGVYYSSDGTGEQIWSLLAAGVPVGDVIAGLSGRYPADGGEIESAVQTFLDELLVEELLRPAPAAAAAPQPPPAEAAPFVAPLLNRYTDFQELLMLDPIHEVEQAVGWPVAKPAEQLPNR